MSAPFSKHVRARRLAVLTGGLALLLCGGGCATSQKQKHPTLLDIQQTDDQKILAKAAYANPDPQVRLAAVKKISNEEFLAKAIILEHKKGDPVKREQHIIFNYTAGTKDVPWDEGGPAMTPAGQEAQLKVTSDWLKYWHVIKDEKREVMSSTRITMEQALSPQFFAYERAGGQHPLLPFEDIAFAVKPASRAALEKVTNPNLLAKIVLNLQQEDWIGPETSIRVAGNVTTTTYSWTEAYILSRIKRLHYDRWLSKKIIDKISDQGAIARIAESSASSSVRKMALDKITDEIFIAGVAKNTRLASVFLAQNTGFFDIDNTDTALLAVGRLKNQTFIADVAKSTRTNIRVRQAAVQKITDREPLQELLLQPKLKREVRAAVEARLQALAGQ